MSQHHILCMQMLLLHLYMSTASIQSRVYRPAHPVLIQAQGWGRGSTGGGGGTGGAGRGRSTGEDDVVRWSRGCIVGLLSNSIESSDLSKLIIDKSL